MDNLTHSLVGVAAAKAGLERLSPGTPALCILAANAPDADIIVLLFGDRWDLLQHHRGITHAIVGTVVLSLLLPLIFYGVDFVWSRFRGTPGKTKLRGLLIASIVVSATHPLLDWTNNYGIRFLLPWNPKWFYGDFVFIVDPFLWLMLGGASFLLTSKTKSSKVIWITLAAVLSFLVIAGPRSNSLPTLLLIKGLWIAALITIVLLFLLKAADKWGSRIALVAFGLVFLYLGAVAYAHSKALTKAGHDAALIVKPNGETISKLAATPTLANPFRWDCVFETDRATYRFDLSLGVNSPVGNVIRYPKPSAELSQLLRTVVSQDRRAQVFFGFARFPVVQLADHDCVTQTLVQLADLRYTEPGRSRGTFSLELPVECPNQQVIGSK
jgi:inner membrane protein